MSEKYLWLYGVAIFVAGFALGNMSFGSKFWEVENVHDLFEIFSSTATVGAVFVAWKGISAWRHQALGLADLELARKVSRAALEVKEQAKLAALDAVVAVREVPFGFSGLPSTLIETLRQTMAIRVDSYDRSLAGLRVPLQEAKAVWGEDFTAKYDEFIEMYGRCCFCAKQFVLWADLTTSDEVRVVSERSIRDCVEDLDRYGMLEENMRLEEIISEKTKLADLELEHHMLRR